MIWHMHWFPTDVLACQLPVTKKLRYQIEKRVTKENEILFHFIPFYSYSNNKDTSPISKTHNDTKDYAFYIYIYIYVIYQNKINNQATI